jgi:NAD(P)-dependent dehydrogenase (short-subunit alcohol dehydrogenase family)
VQGRKEMSKSQPGSWAANVHPLPLDIENTSSIQNAQKHIDHEYCRLDVLMCNDDIAPSVKDLTDEITRKNMSKNLTGTWHLVDDALPLLRSTAPGSRVVMTSARMGDMASITSPELRGIILSAITVEDLSGLWEDYVNSVAEGSSARKGWPVEKHPAYRVSKIWMTRLAFVLARDLRNAGVACNARCPGWAPTDMGGAGAELSVEQAADTPACLATTDDFEIFKAAVLFFAERQELDFEMRFHKF